MSKDKCILCGEKKENADGNTVEETEKTRRMGIPTGFVCSNCAADVDEVEGPDVPCRLSDCRNAEEAAIKTHQFLTALADSTGYAESGVRLFSPDESHEKFDSDCWSVSWQEGPFEWANALLGGESLTSRELPVGGKPEVVGLQSDGFGSETYRGREILFY